MGLFKSKARRGLEEAKSLFDFIEAWVGLALALDVMGGADRRRAEAEFDEAYALLARLGADRAGKRVNGAEIRDEALLRASLVKARIEMQDKTGGMTSEDRERMHRELNEAMLLEEGSQMLNSHRWVMVQRKETREREDASARLNFLKIWSEAKERCGGLTAEDRERINHGLDRTNGVVFRKHQ